MTGKNGDNTCISYASDSTRVRRTTPTERIQRTEEAEVNQNDLTCQTNGRESIPPFLDDRWLHQWAIRAPYVQFSCRALDFLPILYFHDCRRGRAWEGKQCHFLQNKSYFSYPGERAAVIGLIPAGGPTHWRGMLRTVLSIEGEDLGRPTFCWRNVFFFHRCKRNPWNH